MNYSLDLSSEELTQIAAAERQGIAFEPLVRKLIATLPLMPKGTSHPTFTERQTFQARAFEESQMTQEELNAFTDDLLHRVVRGGERQSDGTVKYR